jgi:hypothetical protein
MSRFGETLFNGSRFIFWCLGPLFLLVALLLLYVAYTLLVNGNTQLCGVSLIAAVICGCFFLALLNGRRFWWAARAVTASVFAGYLWYVVDTWLIHPQPLDVGARRSSVTPWNAILGLVIIGLPCLSYTIHGRFRLRALGQQHAPEPPERDFTQELP